MKILLFLFIVSLPSFGAGWNCSGAPGGVSVIVSDNLESAKIYKGSNQRIREEFTKLSCHTPGQSQRAKTAGREWVSLFCKTPYVADAGYIFRITEGGISGRPKGYLSEVTFAGTEIILTFNNCIKAPR